MDPERLPRWLQGFADRHGPVQNARERGGLLVRAADGAVAELRPWAEAAGSAPARPLDPPDSSDPLEWARPPARPALLLLRRGGYAVGTATDDVLTSHHCGTRYVQSRTAAGGWSQQRFARRRGNQADALVASVADRAVAMLTGGGLDALVTGGDRALLRQVLADPRLRDLQALPRREFPDIPDPRFLVLQRVLRRGRAVRILLIEPAP